ncbi:helix-turn-helix domain-containing protein [Bacillus sp. NP157]|nr:helix-turn-helix domain-containing protein [Bacillus sp. NP157]
MNALPATMPHDASVRDCMFLLRAAIEEFDQDLALTRQRILRAAYLLGLKPAPAPVAVGGTLPFPPRKREAVYNFIQQNLDRPIYVVELAEHLDVSTSHFCRAFKASFGMSTHRYIVEQRLKQAVELMRTTTMPLTDIALETGLCDQSHLSNLFRRHFGDSPSRWRRQHS